MKHIKSFNENKSSNEYLKQSKKQLYSEIKDTEGVNGAGITNDEIVIYLSKETDETKKLPKKYNDFNVSYKLTGIIKAS
jgi:hypothetical protein